MLKRQGGWFCPSVVVKELLCGQEMKRVSRVRLVPCEMDAIRVTF
jgi:hypothetical protein